MDNIPTPDETDQKVRQPYEAGPWWAYLALTAFFVSYGLGRDLNSGWATVGEAVSWAILAVASWVQWRRRLSQGATAPGWRTMDAVTWVVVVAYTAVTLAVLFGGPYLLAALGVPLPHAISGLATGLVLIAVIPMGRWSFERAVARIESGE
jgi:hypothetical protein